MHLLIFRDEYPADVKIGDLVAHMNDAETPNKAIVVSKIVCEAPDGAPSLSEWELHGRRPGNARATVIRVGAKDPVRIFAAPVEAAGVWQNIVSALNPSTNDSQRFVGIEWVSSFTLAVSTSKQWEVTIPDDTLADAPTPG